ncbi:MAG TPA: SH3 domain-containing protein [Verrucomicrobiae bacterium]|jgi:SH3-like domain-containing protein|nr:SH3 domain-containing protein [Verrucomicrobiae bacterium]
MKIKIGLILAALVSTSVMAQVTNTPPPLPPMPDSSTVTPPPPPLPPDTGTNKPPGRVKKHKKPASKPAAEKKEKKEKSAAAADAMPAAPVMFTPNQLAESKQDHVNIRGQAHISSEVIGHLKKGETVTVLEEVTLKHPKADEPAHWARIALPSDMHVWVMSAYLDSSNQVVKARKLNLRTGAGENYSVAGLLHKGDTIKTIKEKGSWSEIEAPTNAFAFVAAHLLTPKEGGATIPEIASTTPVPPPVLPTPTVLSNPNTVAPASGVPGAPASEPVPNTQPTLPLPPIPAPVPAPVSDEPLPPRIVQREGVVGGTFSIQAPTYFELRSLDNGRVMDYLYTASTNIVLKKYQGLTIHVSGPEELDERWPNTPVLTIQRIQVVK